MKTEIKQADYELWRWTKQGRVDDGGGNQQVTKEIHQSKYKNHAILTVRMV